MWTHCAFHEAYYLVFFIQFFYYMRLVTLFACLKTYKNCNALQVLVFARNKKMLFQDLLIFLLSHNGAKWSHCPICLILVQNIKNDEYPAFSMLMTRTSHRNKFSLTFFKIHGIKGL